MKIINKITIFEERDIELISKDFDGNLLNKSNLKNIVDKVINTAKKYEHSKEAICKIATLYLSEISKYHPFLDGNKRTATLITLLFLRINGFKINLTYNRIIYFVLKLVNNDMSEKQLEKEICNNTEQIY